MPMYKKVELKEVVKELKSSGGWIYTMLTELLEEEAITKIVIISVNRENKDDIAEAEKVKVITIKDNPTVFFRRKKLKRKIQKYILLEKPNIVDVQGVEFSFSDIESESCVVKTIQGIPFELYKYQKKQCLGKISTRYLSIYDVLFWRHYYIRNYFMRARSKIAQIALRQAYYVIGRTEWDKAVSKGINNKLRYYSAGRIIRGDFYKYEWDIVKTEKNSVFTIGFSSINKGFDVLIKALSIVAKKFPDVKLYVPGKLNTSIIKGKWYDRYILHEIKKYGLENNVRFLGGLSAEQMADKLAISRVFVSPSLNENSSNAIAEAQIVGTPVVATYSGGNSTYVADEYTGLLYNPWDEFMCANRIMQLFEDDMKCNTLSNRAKEVAKRRHEKEKAVKDLVMAYKSILDDFEKRSHIDG